MWRKLSISVLGDVVSACTFNRLHGLYVYFILCTSCSVVHYVVVVYIFVWNDCKSLGKWMRGQRYIWSGGYLALFTSLEVSRQMFRLPSHYLTGLNVMTLDTYPPLQGSDTDTSDILPVAASVLHRSSYRPRSWPGIGGHSYSSAAQRCCRHPGARQRVLVQDASRLPIRWLLVRLLAGSPHWKWQRHDVCTWCTVINIWDSLSILIAIKELTKDGQVTNLSTNRST